MFRGVRVSALRIIGSWCLGVIHANELHFRDQLDYGVYRPQIAKFKPSEAVTA